MPLPVDVPAATGIVTVQVQRTIHQDRSTDGAGERTILEQTGLAIGAAQRTIYLENQRIDLPEVLVALRATVDRGVEVVAVVPAEDAHAPGLLALTQHERFTLVGLTGRAPDGSRHPPRFRHGRLAGPRVRPDLRFSSPGGPRCRRW